MTALTTLVDDAKFALILVPILMVASAAALIVRFRRARGDTRRQIKWLAAAAGLVAGTYVVVELTSVDRVPVGAARPRLAARVLQGVALVSFGLIPVAIGIAILRHRLFDIDVIVRKTLVYAALVACLAGIYLVGVYAIEAVVRSVSGRSSTLAVTLSTLAVAVAFQPSARPHPGRSRPALLPRPLRRRPDARGVQRPPARGDRPGGAQRRRRSRSCGDALHPAHVALWLRPTGDER